MPPQRHERTLRESQPSPDDGLAGPLVGASGIGSCHLESLPLVELGCARIASEVLYIDAICVLRKGGDRTAEQLHAEGAAPVLRREVQLPDHLLAVRFAGLAH